MTVESPAAATAHRAASTTPETLDLLLEHQVPTHPGSDRFHRLRYAQQWQPERTAIIVCDVWDLHHCLNAVRRIQQFVPRLNQVLSAARRRGVTVIHSPSDCMEAYANHPARIRAQQAATAKSVPPGVAQWCSSIPTEEAASYPIDQSDGGEDDDPLEHAQWVARLTALGRNPAMPWKSQTAGITIDPTLDFITDRGDEVWNILEERGIENVILTGVHTNMCVLGRPFGLRQMARQGKHVVLMRDLTDTMYNPQRWPFVSHFTGTDLIVDHIERYVCPTITSDQLAGGQPFRFRDDHRPHVVMVIAEDEYRTEQTLPEFASRHLQRDFRISFVFGSERQRHRLPGMFAVKDADLLLLSVRRRLLPPEDMAIVQDFVRRGKPVIGIRTACHAFAVRDEPSDGLSDWPQLDPEVFGGAYDGHYSNDDLARITMRNDVSNHPLLHKVTRQAWTSGGSLYKVSPLAPGTTTLLTGTLDDGTQEPVAWTFVRNDSGRSFYTSLGHPDDFQQADFRQLLFNAVYHATGLEQPSPPITDSDRRHPVDQRDHWSLVQVPADSDATGQADPVTGALADSESTAWYRSIVVWPGERSGEGSPDQIVIPQLPVDQIQLWINGQALRSVESEGGDTGGSGLRGDGRLLRWTVDPGFIEPSDANLLVVRLQGRSGAPQLASAPVLYHQGQSVMTLAGTWQTRVGDDASWSSMPLPAKFGGSASVVFTAPEPLFVPRPLTPPGEFTPGIEGPACDAQGNIFAVNFQRQGTIGRVQPGGAGEVFVDLPDGSIGNGIRFDRSGYFYVADYTGHNVLRIDPVTREIHVFAHHDDMNQPNDLAIARDGTLYASDPNWDAGTGQLWRIDTDGTVTRLQSDMGTTNGIDISPDGRTLYVNESVQRNVWAFTITPDKTLTDKRLVRRFDDYGFDGMRCDVEGNLYITRHFKGTVVKLSPAGEVLREIDTLGTRPSNLCFGGPDGRTVYVTEVDQTRIVQFRVDRPGAAWSAGRE